MSNIKMGLTIEEGITDAFSIVTSLSLWEFTSPPQEQRVKKQISTAKILFKNISPPNQYH